MKKFLYTFFCILLINPLFAQDKEEGGMLQVQGFSSQIIYPESYRIAFLLQEEQQRGTYEVVGKTNIDSIDQAFRSKLKTFNVDMKNLTLKKRSSLGSGQHSTPLFNEMFELRNVTQETAGRS